MCRSQSEDAARGGNPPRQEQQFRQTLEGSDDDRRRDDGRWMHSALEAAREAAEAGDVPVGAVLVHGGRELARCGNRREQDQDPTAHAEIVALRAAAAALGNHRLDEATLYVTLEPCPMCLGAILEARVARLVFGAYDERAGAAGSAIDLTATLPSTYRLEVNGGLLREECAALLAEFFAERRED